MLAKHCERRIEARIAGALTKYFDGGYSGHATLECEGPDFRTGMLTCRFQGHCRAEGNAAGQLIWFFDQAVLHVEKSRAAITAAWRAGSSAGMAVRPPAD